jgi:hypothetical protein
MQAKVTRPVKRNAENNLVFIMKPVPPICSALELSLSIANIILWFPPWPYIIHEYGKNAEMGLTGQSHVFPLDLTGKKRSGLPTASPRLTAKRREERRRLA